MIELSSLVWLHPVCCLRNRRFVSIWIAAMVSIFSAVRGASRLLPPQRKGKSRFVVFYLWFLILLIVVATDFNFGFVDPFVEFIVLVCVDLAYFSWICWETIPWYALTFFPSRNPCLEPISWNLVSTHISLGFLIKDKPEELPPFW